MTNVHSWTATRKRHAFSLLASALICGALVAASATAQEAKKGAEAIETQFPIDDADPEKSVPDAKAAMKDPMQMGYLMMAFSDRAEDALKKGQPSKAAKYFRAMGKAVPDRAVSFRKACSAHHAAGETDKAIEMCRAALGKGGVTVADHVTFLQVMLKKRGKLTNSEIGDIDAVVERLHGELGLSREEQGRRLLADIRCQAAARTADATRLASCTDELTRLRAEKAQLLPYAWAHAMSLGNLSEAETVKEEAIRAKLPASAIEVMEMGLAKAQAANGGSLNQLAKRWWPAALALLAALSMFAAIKMRRRSSTSMG